MDITYLGHAGFYVEAEQFVLVMDPWLSPEGAFDSAWFQFPCNHYLAPWLCEALRQTKKERFVYVSHEHRDHFDPDFLSKLPLQDITFLVPRFDRPALREELAKFRPKAIVPVDHGQQINVPGGAVRLFLDDGGINRDSAILVKSRGESFLNMNDCKLYDEVADIAQAEGPISVFTCQFSGATWHPTCYEYDPAEYTRISSHKLKSKFEMVARAISAVQPKCFIPSAGPACFLDPMLFHINFQPVNIFPRTAQFFSFLRERLNGIPTAMVDMMPGDVWRSISQQFRPLGTQRVDEANFASYLRSYAARYERYFADRQPKPAEADIRKTVDLLQTALQTKLEPLALNARIQVPLYFGLSDVDGKLLRIDFPAKRVDPVSQIQDADYYSLTTPSWQIQRVLDGKITWEEFALTFRVRLNRKPDIYQTLIQGFLLMEPEDMNTFCSKLLEIEQRQMRITIEAGGTRYSIDRYCPHQGADLAQGWLSEGRYWVCPRHRWHFALDKEGQCMTNKGSIHATCLDHD